MVIGASILLWGTGGFRPGGWLVLAFGGFPVLMALVMLWKQAQPPAAYAMRPPNPCPGETMAIRWNVPQGDRGKELTIRVKIIHEHGGGDGSWRTSLTRATLLKTTRASDIADGGLEFILPIAPELTKRQSRESLSLIWKIFFDVDFNGLRGHRSHAVIHQEVAPSVGTWKIGRD